MILELVSQIPTNFESTQGIFRVHYKFIFIFLLKLHIVAQQPLFGAEVVIVDVDGATQSNFPSSMNKYCKEGDCDNDENGGHHCGGQSRHKNFR